MTSRRASQRLVEPSMSVSRNVTVPVGRSSGSRCSGRAHAVSAVAAPLPPRPTRRSRKFDRSVTSDWAAVVSAMPEASTRTPPGTSADRGISGLPQSSRGTVPLHRPDGEGPVAVVEQERWRQASESAMASPPGTGAGRFQWSYLRWYAASTVHSGADVDSEVWAVVEAAMQLRLVAWCEEAAQSLVDLRHVAEWVQFPFDGVKSRGDVGVFPQPAVVIRLQLAQLLHMVVHLGDAVVEPGRLGHDDLVVGRLGLDLPVGPLLGVMAPVAALPAAIGGLGAAFGFLAPSAGGVEVAGGLALDGVGVAASACFE